MIIYTEQRPNVAAHRALLRQANPNWSNDRVRRVLRAFRHSDFAAAAYANTADDNANDQPVLIGTVRVFSDGVAFAMIADLLIAPNYRRQGVASELVRLCQHRFAGFYLYADAQNSQAAKLYQKLGFKEQQIYLSKI